MTTVAQAPPKGYRTIRLPLDEQEYERFLTDRPYAKARLQELYEDAPELFPEAFPEGYALYGFTDPSGKQQLRCRRLRLQETQDVFTVAPAFVMPYIPTTSLHLAFCLASLSVCKIRPVIALLHPRH
jgi:hypothetical protein